MERVLVIGSPGAGKSTFARALADRTGLPLCHLDAEYWRSGWVETPANEWNGKLAGLLARPQWIIDGNYGGSMLLRLERADTAVFLDFSTPLCLWRVLRRLMAHRGTTRPDMAPGCPERFNVEFLHYVARFRRDKRPAMMRRLAGFAGTLVRLETPDAARRWLSQVPRP